MSVKSNEKTISQKIADLENLVSWFESDDFVLEEALTQYKKAEKLADEITNELEVLQNDITVLKKRFDED
jgi:exodeoxyribonuclease VII small subunit